MPADETPRERPRPWLLAALGIAIVALVFYWMYPSSSPAGPSNQARNARAPQAAGQEGASFDVQLDRLKEPPPEPREGNRNPFRFQPKPPPAPPPMFKPPPVAQAPQPVQPPAPTGPPPIPLKFFAILEGRPGKIAGLTDGRDVFKGREGDIIDGRYRIVKIGVESIVMEYVDGRGRQTIPLRGQ